MGRRFIIGDTGETLITAEWIPEPAMEAQALNRLSFALDNWTEPMGEARAIIREDIRKRFDTETDPSGTPWQALSPDYHMRKMRDNKIDKILQRDGDLYDSATSGEAIFAEERTIMFNPSVLPFYGEYHQTGLPERQNPLPQRQFIGLDEETENELEALFVFWLNRTTEINYPTDIGLLREVSPITTTTGFRGIFTDVPSIGGGTSVRGAGGRFIGKTFQV